MTLQANLEILKVSFPETWQKICELETTLDKNLVRVVTNKKAAPILQVGQVYVHDRKNPRQDAKNFIEQFKNIPEHSDILFYGVGLGYHISAYAEKYPDKSFSIYEPVPEVFYQFLCNTDLQQFPFHLVKNIHLESSQDDPEKFCRNLVTRVRKSILIIALPAYHSLFPKKSQTFFNQFTIHLNERKMELGPYMIFQKLWTTNIVKNFTHVLNSPNVLLGKRKCFFNKPAILVASGPSLEEEIENLREIRQKGLAYIFSVGTALNALVKRGIYPHAACTYDPSEENQIVCREVLEKDIKSIPLLFGSTVGHETVEKYPGPKMHMLISQDSLARFCLKPQGSESLDFINDAPSIAVIALQLLYKLGFNPIILVGQNLAYLDGKNYTDGSTYPSHEACQMHLKNATLVKDVNGNEVPASETYIRIRLHIENYLRDYQDAKVINTTKRGAHIEGTKFLPLDEVMGQYLLSPVVEKDCWHLSSRSYDLDYLFEQNNSMNTACTQVTQLLEKCRLDLDNIVSLAPSGDVVNIEESYNRFNLSMENLRKNLFFANLITHMSRVELQFLLQVIPEISRERNPLRKAHMMEKEFRSYLDVCEQDIYSVIPIYQELNQKLDQFNKVYSVRKKAAKTKVLLLVCDGILTDGYVYISAAGEESEKFSHKDRAGIRILREKGIQTLLINPEASPLLNQAAQKLEIDTITSNKREIVDTTLAKYSLNISEIACICSNPRDWELCRKVGLSFAVKDASPEVQQNVDFVLTAKGGQGVLWEIADLLTKDLRF
ncbi:6-hydroxymethylpterin diphosphokinase MptE-like protein [Phosphitispora fastidiosa]|uniref:6-hydroxymethylpterin diphosphokinase MptE-like protein n=1 Tax=Phosphitispora fastidiosa TaxID=2837202 RepID=UPI001E31DC9D|nr:6-hydroxymethylpterin diphosphokinase MptE-like protein [Phosphitispora fastidiosa]MBU7008496.1 YrbI family 3-deoxy-D-manno-octulosonate 8-phosphate phosphatase [Phosphitispora fastidiosa]